jgi:hypothetical protein
MLQARFSALARLLSDLGFTSRSKAGAFIRFDHPESGAWFLYPDYAPDEEVNAADIVGTRYLLDARGILTRDQFDERIRQLSLVG